jgi:hypothetical protein
MGKGTELPSITNKTIAQLSHTFSGTNCVGESGTAYISLVLVGDNFPRGFDIYMS